MKSILPAFLFLLALPGLLPVAEAAEGGPDPAPDLVPEQYASWWPTVEPVRFHCPEGHCPAKLASLTGNVFDSEGRPIATVTVSRQQGVRQTDTFILSNESGYEPEMEDFVHQHKLWGQSFGLFRALPWVEPRLPALVLQNFLALAGNHAAYVAEYDLGGGASGVLLDTAHGRQWVVWLDRDHSLKDLLPGGIPPSAEVSDWEGRNIPLQDDTLLAADSFYYLSGIPEAPVGLSEKEVLTLPRPKKAKTGQIPQGTLNAKPLFTDGSGEDLAPGIAWNDQGWDYHPIHAASPAPGLSARFALGAIDPGVDLVVDVSDAVQFQNGSGPALWSGDSIQFAFDCDGSGLPGGNAEPFGPGSVAPLPALLTPYVYVIHTASLAPWERAIGPTARPSRSA